MVPSAHPSPYPKRHLDRFSRFAGLTIATDRPTDRHRPRYSVRSNRPHLAIAAMRPNNIATQLFTLALDECPVMFGRVRRGVGGGQSPPRCTNRITTGRPSAFSVQLHILYTTRQRNGLKSADQCVDVTDNRNCAGFTNVGVWSICKRGAGALTALLFNFSPFSDVVLRVM